MKMPALRQVTEMTKWSRYLMVAVLAAGIFLLFYSGVDSKKSADAVFTGMRESVDTSSMEAKSRRELLRYFGINSTDVESFVLYGAANSLDASELLILKARNTAQVQELRTVVEERQLAQIASFEGYDAEQAALLHDAVIQTKGPFLLYVVGTDAEDAADAFAKAVK